MPEQHQLPDLQTAHAIVMENVHKRVFLHKMAQLGHVAATTEEADSLVELGFKVAEMMSQQPGDSSQVKAGSTNRFAEASLDLDKVAGVAPQASNEAAHAALELARDPDVYAAALVLKAAEAQVTTEPEVAQ